MDEQRLREIEERAAKADEASRGLGPGSEGCDVTEALTANEDSRDDVLPLVAEVRRLKAAIPSVEEDGTVYYCNCHDPDAPVTRACPVHD